MAWDGKDRRKKAGTDPITLDDLEEALEIHSVKEREYVREVVQELRQAFPNDDLRGHCEYHERKIKAAQAEEEFWKTAKTTLIQAGVTGILRLIWIVLLLIMLGLTVKFALPETFVKFLLSLLAK